MRVSISHVKVSASVMTIMEHLILCNGFCGSYLNSLHLILNILEWSELLLHYFLIHEWNDSKIWLFRFHCISYQGLYTHEAIKVQQRFPLSVLNFPWSGMVFALNYLGEILGHCPGNYQFHFPFYNFKCLLFFSEF